MERQRPKMKRYKAPTLIKVDDNEYELALPDGWRVAHKRHEKVGKKHYDVLEIKRDG